MSEKNFTASVRDKHSVSLYDVSTGAYEGIIYVTGGDITGTPIVTPNNISVPFTENGTQYISTYSLPNKTFVRKIRI